MNAEQYARYRKARGALIEDWHGVSDAANDIRVLDAQYEVLSKQLTPLACARNPP